MPSQITRRSDLELPTLIDSTSPVVFPRPTWKASAALTCYCEKHILESLCEQLCDQDN